MIKQEDLQVHSLGECRLPSPLKFDSPSHPGTSHFLTDSDRIRLNVKFSDDGDGDDSNQANGRFGRHVASRFGIDLAATLVTQPPCARQNTLSQSKCGAVQLQKADGLLQERSRRNQDLTFFDCLQLSDKPQIVARNEGSEP